VCVSRISQDFKEIQEIEINPLVVQEAGCVAVDALVVVERREDSLKKGGGGSLES
jgi:succinyl-CoA synthetase beta subunit